MSDRQPETIQEVDSAFNRAAVFLERLPNKKAFKPLSGFVKFITRVFYNLISNLDHGENLAFMNYGYHHFESSHPKLALTARDEKFRHQVQMYHRIANAADWSGRDGLEVGSGRGGGASFIKRHFKPKSMTGVDLSDKAVLFCNQYHSAVDGLRFMQGDAEALQFPNESFDIILNVESSLYYPNVENFFRSVVRLLKPGGHFLYADMRYMDEIETWRKQLNDTGLELIEQEDITKNAKQALVLNQEYRKGLVKKYAPKILQRVLGRFGGSDGGRLAEKPGEEGKRVYMRFALRKTGD